MLKRSKVEQQLVEAVAGVPPLPEIARNLEEATEKTLRVVLMSSAYELAVHGEYALSNNRLEGWNVLAVARRVRALTYLLEPNVASSPRAALAGLEALQYREDETASSLARMAARGYRNDWDSTGPLVSSREELEALLFELLRVKGLDIDPGVDLSPLCYLAPAAGAEPAPEDSVGLAFEQAFDHFSELCRGDRRIPIGARLSAAPVFACLTVRQDCGLRLPDPKEPIVHPWFVAPFKDYPARRKAKIPALFEPVLIELQMRAEELGYKMG